MDDQGARLERALRRRKTDIAIFTGEFGEERGLRLYAICDLTKRKNPGLEMDDLIDYVREEARKGPVPGEG